MALVVPGPKTGLFGTVASPVTASSYPESSWPAGQLCAVQLTVMSVFFLTGIVAVVVGADAGALGATGAPR